MSAAVVMPKLGDIMESGTVRRWLKTNGDWVSKGELLFELESEKVSFEVEAVSEGYLHRLVTEGTEIAIGELVALLLTREEAAAQVNEGDRSA